jgi:proton glutamate symport protein
LISPGVGATKPDIGTAAQATANIASNAEATGVADIFLRMIPANIFAAASTGDMLGLIFFSLLFGYFMTKIPTRPQQTLQQFWEGIFDVMLMTAFVMRFAPLGVFALVSVSIAREGFDQFANLLWFALTVVLALAIHFIITMSVILRVVGKIKQPWLFYQAMLPALLTAFSTSSSSATLPVTITSLEQRAGVSNRVSSFVLPLGATVNMDGTALYECVAAIFIAQVFGVELSFGQQLLIVITALTTSIGVAGIPSASLVAISIILHTVGLPMEAIGMLLVVDRLLDMLRTAVNVFSDSVGAMIIARSEGEQTTLQG